MSFGRSRRLGRSRSPLCLPATSSTRPRSSILSPGGASVSIKCANQWTPVFENGGHECLIAWTNASNIAYPFQPDLDGSAGPGDNWSIAQHNLGVLPVGSGKRHLIKYAFQVCNGADEERGFVVAARQAPLEEIEAFLPGVPGGRAILDKPGKVERLGIVASADPSDAELEQARAELTVKIAAQRCRRFTLGGVLTEGNALINVTQSHDERVGGGLSVLAMAEEKDEGARVSYRPWRRLTRRFACLCAAPPSPAHRCELPFENVQRVLFFGFQIPELHVLQNDFKRVADAAELPPITPNSIEKLALKVRFSRVAEIDVDEAELSALLIEGPGIDRLHELIRREGNLERRRHGGLRARLAQAAQRP